MIKLHSIIQKETAQPERFSYEVPFHLRKHTKAIMLAADKGLNSANISINTPADTICRSFYFETLNLANFYLGLQGTAKVTISNEVWTGKFDNVLGKWQLPADPTKLEFVTNGILKPSYNAVVFPRGYFSANGIEIGLAGFAWQGKWYGFNTSSYIDPTFHNLIYILKEPEFAALFNPILKKAQEEYLNNVPKQSYVLLPLKNYSHEIFHINGIVYPNVNGETIGKINIGVYLQTEEVQL